MTDTRPDEIIILEFLSRQRAAAGVPAIFIAKQTGIPQTSIYAPLSRLTRKGDIIQSKMSVGGQMAYAFMVTGRKKTINLYKITNKGVARYERYKK